MGRKQAPIKHGTIYGYKKRGCRCDKCRAANKEHCRAYSRKAGVMPQGQVCELPDGRLVGSQVEAAAALGVCKSTVTHHLNRYGDLKRIGAKPGGKAPSRCKPVRIGSRTWESSAALERYLGVNPGRVYDWKRRNDMNRLMAALLRADAAAMVAAE